MVKFIIENCEGKLSQWSFIEYKSASRYVGKENIIFSNITKRDADKLKKFGKVKVRSVKELDIEKEKVIILDPESKIELKTEDFKKYDYFIFGGILGDYPRKKRTEEFLTSKLNFQTRNLGIGHLSTDNALLTAKLIMDGKKLREIEFQEELNIDIDTKGEIKEVITLPFLIQ